MEVGTTMSAGQADINVPGFPLPGAAPDILERAYKVVKHLYISICQVLGPHKASQYHDDLLTFLCPTSTPLQRNLARDSIEGLVILHTHTPSKLALLHNIFASYVHYEAFHLPRIPCKKLSVEGNLMLEANMDRRLGINEEFRRSAGINGVEKTWRDAMSHASPYICEKLIKAADRARKSRDVADLETALNDMSLFGDEDQMDSLADGLGGVGISREDSEYVGGRDTDVPVSENTDAVGISREDSEYVGGRDTDVPVSENTDADALVLGGEHPNVSEEEFDEML